MRVEGYRKFCNKIWNATKFAMMKFPADYVPAKSAQPSGKETLVEQWILSRLNTTATELNRYMSQRNFQMATSTIYDFWLYQLCDVYIEAMKPLSAEDAPEDVRRSAQDTLYTALEYGLKMLHPFMPFVTEELWQRLPRRPEDKTVTIALASFPQAVRSTYLADEVMY
jgi:valyl-tRNA synthetase